MTSDQQDPDLNNSVHKPPIVLNPNADTFCSKVLTPSVDKGLEQVEDCITNGDLNQDDVGGAFSSGDSPASDSPSASGFESGLEAGSFPPQFVPESMVENIAPDAMAYGAEAGAASVDDTVMDTFDNPVRVEGPGVIGVQSTNDSDDADVGPDQAQENCTEEKSDPAQAPETANTTADSSDLRTQLQKQLEYYFSRDNLILDPYLQSQMDGDQYVSIATIANFNKVFNLTKDIHLIVDVLKKCDQLKDLPERNIPLDQLINLMSEQLDKDSNAVQVDDTETRVRPRPVRSVLMLREIPENTPKEEVEALFSHPKCPHLINCEFAHNGYWYITFKSDDDASSAFCFLREHNIMFRNKPVLARIKAKPLVRTGGSSHLVHTKPHSQQQQDVAALSYVHQQQPQYPMITPMPPYVSQQQVPSAVSPYPMYNYTSPLLQQWTNTTAPPAYIDPGAMLTMNGLQATAVKPSTNHGQNMYHHQARNNNNRGRGKPHHRPQSISTDKVQEPRSMDRPHSNNLSATRPSPRSNHQHVGESLSQPPPFARSRSEGSAGNGHFNSTLQSSASTAPTPLVPEESLSLHLPAQPQTNSKSDSVSASVQQKRGGNHRRRKDDGAKNSRSNINHGNRDGRPHDAHFELEATSFPPLPGSSNNSTSGDAHEGSKLSDVVKGTSRPNHSRSDEKVKAVPAPLSSSSTTPAVASAAEPVSTPVSVDDSCPVAQIVNANTISSPAPTVSDVTSPELKESEVSGNGLSSCTASQPSATAVHSSAQSAKAGKTASQTSVSSAAKAGSEIPVASRQSTVSAAPVKVNLTAVSSPVTEGAPARLSYAQMVARRQQAENAAKQLGEEGTTAATATASPTTQTAREQNHTQASASVSASTPHKSASASANATARHPFNDLQRNDFDPRDQRSQGGRRDNRQPRGDRDRRRNDRGGRGHAK